MKHRILFYLLRPFLSFKRYSNPDTVGGWRGWYEIFGYVLAFEDIQGKRFFSF